MPKLPSLRLKLLEGRWCGGCRISAVLTVQRQMAAGTPFDFGLVQTTAVRCFAASHTSLRLGHTTFSPTDRGADDAMLILCLHIRWNLVEVYCTLFAHRLACSSNLSIDCISMVGMLVLIPADGGTSILALETAKKMPRSSHWQTCLFLVSV